MRYLSHILNSDTPTYGNRNKFQIEKKSDISKGDIANDTTILTTVHIGTHIDMPYHFYENGQTIIDFPLDFWNFNNTLFLEIKPKNQVIFNEIIEKLETLENNYDILIIKTGLCYFREDEKFWKNNYGFSEKLYDYLIDKFSKIRVIGFDSISISSFQNRVEGRKAHKKFLNPKQPILILEDMDLKGINNLTKIQIIPLRIEKCDGLPCTVIGE